MMDGAPRAFDPVERVFERLDHALPCRGTCIGRNRFDGRARASDEIVHRGRNVFGTDRVETRETGEVEERIQV